MITIIRWWIYKAKVVKLKLGLVAIAEELLKKFADKESEVYKTFADELVKEVLKNRKQYSEVKDDTQS